MKRKISALVVFIAIIMSIASINIYAADNLIQNPSFEDVANGKPANWESRGWHNDVKVSEYKVENQGAHSGSNFVTVNSKSSNDARFFQNVAVKPNSMYKLSCWAMASGVGENVKGKGANISIEGKLETSKDIKGTNNKWEYLEMYVRTGPDTNSVRVTVGLGGYGSENTGTASFDDVAVEEVTAIPQGATVADLNAKQNNNSSNNNNNNSSVNNSANTNLGGPNNSFIIVIVIAAVVLIAGAGYFVYKNKTAANTEPEEHDESQGNEEDQESDELDEDIDDTVEHDEVEIEDEEKSKKDKGNDDLI